MNAHSPYARLFEPLRVRNHELRNRIVMPPMVTVRNILADDGRYGRGNAPRAARSRP